MQGTWIRSLVWEDSMCCRAAKPLHNYWACALEPVLHKMHTAISSRTATRESLQTARKTPMQPKINKYFLKDIGFWKSCQLQSFLTENSFCSQKHSVFSSSACQKVGEAVLAKPVYQQAQNRADQHLPLNQEKRRQPRSQRSDPVLLVDILQPLYSVKGETCCELPIR